MSAEFYILTRFNLRLWPHDKNWKATGTTEWLSHRFNLFEKYCLPSVAAQTCKEFIWVAFLDEDTPEEYKARMEKCRGVCPQLVPVYVPAKYGSNYAGISRAYVNRPVSEGRVISVYFDNDDALNKKFVEKAKALLENASGRTFLYFDS